MHKCGFSARLEELLVAFFSVPLKRFHEEKNSPSRTRAQTTCVLYSNDKSSMLSHRWSTKIYSVYVVQ